MKKLLMFCGCLSVTLSLAACDNKPNTPEEVLESSIQAMEQTNSYRTEVKIEQDIDLFSPGSKQTNELTMDYVKDPLGLHITQNTKIDNVNKVGAQLYFADGDVYTIDSNYEKENWWKGKDTGYHPSLDEAKEYMDLSKRLEDFQRHSEKLKLEEKEEHYILTLTGEGDSFHELSVYFLDISMPAFIDTDWGENLQNNGFTYTIYIDKESFHFTKSLIRANLEMDLTDMEDRLETETTIEEKISKYDELERIVIPDEVIENALDNKTGEKAN